MPVLGAPLDFAKLEARNLRGHQLGSAPSSPVTGQLYYNTGDNTLYWWDGTQWVSARGGAAAIGDATASVKGIIQLAGDLAGTAASPQIAAGVITDAEVATANKDGVAAVASMRTLGSGAQQAMAGSTRLDQITAPTNNVSLNNQRLVSVADAIGPQDAVTKIQLDSVAQGIDAKQSVVVASTANLALSGLAAIDGYTPSAGDRILVKDQTTPSANGIYIAASGAWARATDADSWPELPGAYVFVERGTVNADTGWLCTVDQGGALGTTGVTWTQFSSAGQAIAGLGLTKTGNTIDVGQGTGITVAADLVSIDSTIIPRYYSSATHGAGTTITITQATHGCRASRGLHIQVQDEATGAVELPDMSVAANGDVTVTYAASVAANSKRVTVIG